MQSPGCSAAELSGFLNDIIERELATIGAIDTAMPLERKPGYVILFLATKQGKQANIAQMTAMLRAAGVQPASKATLLESFLKVQTGLLERIGTTQALRAFRAAEAEIAAKYADVYGRVQGLYRKGIQRAWHRSLKHLTVLTAHIGKRGLFDVEEKLALPVPLDHYFAHKDARVCMRCLIDRPGKLPPIERSDPHPYQYVCSACHDEVLSDFPAEFVGKVDENHVLERAIGKPSKLKAEQLVLCKMAGLAPDLPPPSMPRKNAIAVAKKEHAPLQPRSRTEIELPRSADELLYTELLFDYESVRENW